MSGLRACLRCALIKTFEQFHHDGCENCDFLSMEGNTERINQASICLFLYEVVVLKFNFLSVPHPTSKV
jgi:transcription elongation factor SPT4